MITVDGLKQAIDVEGFGLEQKTLKIFKDAGFIAENNFPLVNNLNVDVFAYPKPTDLKISSIFVIECKGSSPSHYLSLMDESKRVIDEKPNTYPFSEFPRFRLREALAQDGGKGLSYYSPDSAIENSIKVCAEETDPKYITFRYCYTGDFRTGTAPYKKLPKQDNKNNLYKGVMQVLANVSNLQTKIAEIAINYPYSHQWVLPVIVTNAKICVCTEHDQLIEVPWAIYDCERITSSKDNALSIKYVFIVNINNLPNFVKKMG